MKAWIQVSVIVSILLSFTACRTNSAEPSMPTPFFLKERDPQNVYLLADLRGELVVADGCIRINSIDGKSYLPIWPYGFSLQIKGNLIQILDATDQFVAQVGDNLFISGGIMPGEHRTVYARQPIPVNCPGPYWIVGLHIER
jgi:hypothetical protein